MRPTGLAAAAPASAQCTPQSTGMVPMSTNGTRTASPQASQTRVPVGSRSDIQHRFRAVEGLGVAGPALHPAQPGQAEEDLVVPPVAVLLGRVRRVQQF